MRVFILAGVAATMLARGATAQTTFDAVTFTPPSSFQRAEQNGMVSFQKMGTAGRRPTYCQIFLFPSHPAAPDAQQNFTADWARLVARPFATNTPPQIETRSTPEGWTVVTGYLNVVQRGIPVMAILVTATGPNRALSIVVNVTSGDYGQEVRGFLGGLQFGASTSVAAPSSPLPAPPPAPSSQLPAPS